MSYCGIRARSDLVPGVHERRQPGAGTSVEAVLLLRGFPKKTAEHFPEHLFFFEKKRETHCDNANHHVPEAPLAP